MARRNGFLAAMERASKEANRQRIQREKDAQREQARSLKRAAQAQREHERAIVRSEKERKAQHIADRLAEVEDLNDDLAMQLTDLESLLTATLKIDDHFDLDELKPKLNEPTLDLGSDGSPITPPSLDDFLPTPLTGISKLLPGKRRQYDTDVEVAKGKLEDAQRLHARLEAERLERVANARLRHNTAIEEARNLHKSAIAEIDEFKAAVLRGDPDSVVAYFSLVLKRSSYPQTFPQQFRLAYVPESKQLVIEYELPTVDVIPEMKEYKYNRARDEISSTERPAAHRRATYASVVAQTTLRTIHEVFESDRMGHVDSAVFNGIVRAVDKATGKSVQPCVITLRTTRDLFMQLDLSRVDAGACLKHLNASVSRNPAELEPVRPVLEFNMADRRFVTEEDILSGLDQRPNLMELSPIEFESLITNLFTKMGLESRLTQASRDGGVDCVAFDPRPIFGGKVVIQAKRYKGTVGVSATRDLFGTLQNEGASKGILVTTSGYGQASFDFAAGKPIELIDGANLLYLLSEHAGIEARIHAPDDWHDPTNVER